MEFLNIFEERQRELERICQENPIEIPVPVAAKWLGIAPESLRYAIAQGTCGFSAPSWRKPGKENHAYHIPTANFYKAYSIKPLSEGVTV